MGNFVHSVLEDLFLLQPEERTVSTARGLMAHQWSTNYAEPVTEVLKNSERAIHQFRWNSWWCVENYFKMEDPSVVGSRGVEHELNGFIDGVPLKGFIDRWQEDEEGISISDYKTGKTPKQMYVDGKFFAMTLYADLLSAEIGEQVSKIELLYLKDGVRISKSLTDDATASMRETVKSTYEQVKVRCSTGEFEPIRNTLCGWCNYKTICPAWQ